MKNALKNAYNNNFVFYIVGAAAGLFLFLFTFENIADFFHREFVEAFGLFLFLAFATALALDLKTLFFEQEEGPEEPLEPVEEELAEDAGEGSEIPDSKEKNMPNPESKKPIYEWDMKEQEEEPEATTPPSREEAEPPAEPPKVEKKKAVPIQEETGPEGPTEEPEEPEEEDDTPPEAAGFEPEEEETPMG